MKNTYGDMFSASCDDDYKYETHLHTNETSACAVSSGREMGQDYFQEFTFTSHQR